MLQGAKPCTLHLHLPLCSSLDGDDQQSTSCMPLHSRSTCLQVRDLKKGKEKRPLCSASGTSHLHLRASCLHNSLCSSLDVGVQQSTLHVLMQASPQLQHMPQGAGVDTSPQHNPLCSSLDVDHQLSSSAFAHAGHLCGGSALRAVDQCSSTGQPARRV